MTSGPGPASAPGSPSGTSLPRSVLLAGGGSAGHVSPLLALADALRRRDPDMVVTALGTEQGLESRLVPARGYELRTIPKVPLPRRPSSDLVRLPGNLRAAVAAAGRAIDETGAEVVVGFGGYVSTPAYLAARKRRVPIVVHEQNARPGIANRLGARFTPHVATTFASTALRGATVVGMPLRREIALLDRGAIRAEALEHFGLEADRPTVLVTGGSLGAQRLNHAFEARVDGLRAAGVQVLHITGLGKEFEPGSEVVGPPYVVLAFADRMDLAYAAADLVVARAGANTVCELTAVGLPAVYVPLPIGNGEQRFNAADVVAAGGGILVDDSALTPEWIDRELLPLVADGGRIQAMAEAAASVGERGADEALADMVQRARAGSPGSSR
jgi:UDP-N-acetylglucosamine--N-acetylmuramyl-(pentapeptide) pyrophosphoryl-undecaprenol N-acetylglucosamine transferase